MTRRRWMADEVSGKRAVLLGAHAAHLVKVLRARLGQQFDIACGSAVRKGTIVSLAPERIEFELAESVATTPVPELTLLLSVFKFDRMEWAIEKCVELGTAHIIPTISSRTESHLASAAIKRSERWKRIALQAAEQSRRAALPEISAPVKLAEAVKRKDGLRIVLSESEHVRTLRTVLEGASSGPFALAIGPEGGWSPAELELFDKEGWISTSLGTTILRAETAAIAAVAVAISSLS